MSSPTVSRRARSARAAPEKCGRRSSGRGGRPLLSILMVAALAEAVPAGAQPAGRGAPVEGPVLTVTGRPLPQPAGAEIGSTTVIDRGRIVAEPSARLENLLQDVAGLQQFRRSDSRTANPTSQGETARGLGGNAASRMLVLLDGVPQADPFGGWIPWPALAPERIGLVRITRGSGVGAFGSGAVAGTIELVSPGADDASGPYAAASYGSRDSIQTAAGLVGGLGVGHASLDGRYDRGDGQFLVPERQRGPADVRARYEQWSVATRAVIPVADEVELQARAVGFGDVRRRGLVGVGSRSEGGDASLRLVGRGDWAWEALGYVQARRFGSDFGRVEEGRTAVIPTLDQYNTPATGLGGKLEVRPPLGDAIELQLGADFRDASGETRERFSYVNGAFTRLRRAGGRTDIGGVYAEAGWRASPDLTLTAGLRGDRWWIRNGRLTERAAGSGALQTDLRFEDRSGWQGSGRVGAAYAITPAVKLRAAAYRGFRLPTLNELYRPYRVGADAVAANASLRAERLDGVEAGLELRPIPSLTGQVTLFANRLERAIANVTVARGPGNFPQVGFVTRAGRFQQRQNLDAVESLGLEAAASLALGRVNLDVSYAYTDAEVEASGLAAPLDGLRPAQVARHAASAGLRYAWGATGEAAGGAGGGAGGHAAVTLRYFGPQFEDDLNSLRLDEAVTVDASAAIPLARRLALTLAAENLFDEEIEAGVDDDGLLDLGPARTLWIGLRVTG